LEVYLKIVNSRGRVGSPLRRADRHIHACGNGCHETRHFSSRHKRR